MIANLIEILPPAESPIDTDERMLELNQFVLRVDFPEDFVEFGRTYGSGTVTAGQAWEVWSPFRPTYPQIVLNCARGLQEFKAAMEIEDVPFDIYPDVGGILPFSKTPDGNLVCFRTEGEPDQWDIVDLGAYEEGSYEVLQMSFSGYFFNVLIRKVILRRHKSGKPWNPKTDLKFDQKVYVDQGY